MRWASERHVDAAGHRAAGREQRGASAIAASTGSAGFAGWRHWLIAALAIGAWDLVVRVNQIPPYILPGPGLVAYSLVTDWWTLWPSLLVTLKITAMALAAAIVGGVGLAVLFSLSRWVELSLFPFAVILQVTPIVAIAPLILIYVDNTYLALLICAWIVAFFPILSNTTLGLNSADHNLRDLFQLYRATRWQQLLLLRLPAAMPYFLGGLKIAGGLVPDRRHRRRVRRRHRRHRLGPRLPHPRGRLPPQYPAHVRGTDPDQRDGDPDLPRLHAAPAPGPAPLARERAASGRADGQPAAVVLACAARTSRPSRRSERSTMPSSSRWAVVLKR